SAQIREILISESAWEEMTCLFAPSLEECDLESEFYYSKYKSCFEKLNPELSYALSEAVSSYHFDDALELMVQIKVELSQFKETVVDELL
ncbi:hypothetical protein M8U30_26320, partial [Enterobacter asburiae]|nr:hypothetical protein [Enterobacter asburiae]